MKIELTKEELKLIKSCLHWTVYWMENKDKLKNLQQLLNTLDKELEKSL